MPPHFLKHPFFFNFSETLWLLFSLQFHYVNPNRVLMRIIHISTGTKIIPFQNCCFQRFFSMTAHHVRYSTHWDFRFQFSDWLYWSFLLIWDTLHRTSQYQVTQNLIQIHIHQWSRNDYRLLSSDYESPDVWLYSWLTVVYRKQFFLKVLESCKWIKQTDQEQLKTFVVNRRRNGIKTFFSLTPILAMNNSSFFSDSWALFQQ